MFDNCTTFEMEAPGYSGLVFFPSAGSRNKSYTLSVDVFMREVTVEELIVVMFNVELDAETAEV
jgi:hypothetical protein